MPTARATPSPTLDLRLREAPPQLLSLPWREPLAEWDVTAVAMRDVPVGPSRHLVRFVEADGRLWALKALPPRVALHEYKVLREAESRSLDAVRPAGLALQPSGDEAVLVTRFLERSWQYRRLLMRVPWTMATHRSRLFEAMATLLVDLHRNGVYWGDCSLANTLFMRDGQSIRAFLVDAETAEFHPSLTDGQRQMDVDIMVENIAGGLLEVAARRDEPPEATTQAFEEARGVAGRYDRLWLLLHEEPAIALGDQHDIASRLHLLNEFGFAVDEVRLTEGTGSADGPLQMTVAVGGRRFHAGQLRVLTGLEVGEGQAVVLMDDLHEHRRQLEHDLGHPVSERDAAMRWFVERFTPMADAAHAAVAHHGGRAQAYCDLLEVRWLLSEEAGHDVGDEPALHTLAARQAPGGSAADLAFVDMPTEELPVLDRRLMDDLDGDDEEPDRAVDADGAGVRAGDVRGRHAIGSDRATPGSDT